MSKERDTEIIKLAFELSKKIKLSEDHRIILLEVLIEAWYEALKKGIAIDIRGEVEALVQKVQSTPAKFVRDDVTGEFVYKQ